MDETLGLNPVHFFALEAPLRRMSRDGSLEDLYPLPGTHGLTEQEDFTEVFGGWNEGGLAFTFHVHQPVRKVYYPAIERGDAVEIFLDTRNRKDVGFNTRFCHHFFFLPSEVEGVDRGELTRFRSEDAHPICEAKALGLEVRPSRAGYEMKIFIPASCLHGYDGSEFPMLGFSYRVHRSGGACQCFSALGEEFTIEQQPSLWATLRLEDEDTVV